MDGEYAPNAMVSEPIYLRDGVTLRTVREGALGTIQTVLVIDDDTRFDAVKKYRKLIQTYYKDRHRVEEAAYSANAIISEEFPLEHGVIVRILKEGILGRIQTLLVVDTRTRFVAVSTNRTLIRNRQKEIDRLQGSDLNYRYEANIHGLFQWKWEGLSWPQLTMELNYLASALACLSNHEDSVQETTNIEVEDAHGLLSAAGFMSGVGGYSLATIFLALREPIETYSECILEAYESLAENRSPFDIEREPFTESQVREAVRYFQRGIKMGKITIAKEDQDWNILGYKIYLVHHLGCLSEADRLLDEQLAWLGYKTMVQGWAIKSVQSWKASRVPRVRKFREIIDAMPKN